MAIYYNLKVSGEGTKSEIIRSLFGIIDSIKDSIENDTDDILFEDETLCGELSLD